MAGKKTQADPQAQMKAMKELYLHELRDLYSAESQIVKALPKMAKRAKSETLRQAFQTHLEQSTRQRDDVEALIVAMGGKAKGVTCKGTQGIIAEAQETMDEHKKSPPVVADTALIGAAQRVEHYEISGYGSARSLAELVGDTEGVAVLDRIAGEEGDTDKLLTGLAQEMTQPLLAQAA
jgi:ferritin-like metal-binding protein YciE